MLTGKTILNCRPEGDSSTLSQLIASHQGHVVECPVLRRLSLLTYDHGDELIHLLERVGPGAIVAFTSPHGVRVTVEFLQEHGAADLLDQKMIAVVGAGTAAEVKRLGLVTYLTSAQAHGEGLALTIVDRAKNLSPVPPVVLLRSENGDKIPAQMLSEAGIENYDFSVYRSDSVEPSRFYESVIRIFEKGGRFDFVVLSSAEGVRQYSKLLSRFSEKTPKAASHLMHTPVIAFAPKTAVAVKELGLILAGTAAEPSNSAVLEALELAILAGRIPDTNGESGR